MEVIARRHSDFPVSRSRDFLVVRQITRSNPAHSVRGPKYVVKKGKTPVWIREDAKTLLDSIPKDSVSGLRDLALISVMFYSFARDRVHRSPLNQCRGRGCRSKQ
jgi:site-specific recombinase XerC